MKKQMLILVTSMILATNHIQASREFEDCSVPLPEEFLHLNLSPLPADYNLQQMDDIFEKFKKDLLIRIALIKNNQIHPDAEKNEFGETLLFVLTSLYCLFPYDTYVIENINLLLEKEADANLTNVNGETPLHFVATQIQSEEIIESLIIKGNANPNLKNRSGKTPLSLAINNLRVENVETLINLGASTTQKVTSYNTETKKDEEISPLNLALNKLANLNVQKSRFTSRDLYKVNSNLNKIQKIIRLLQEPAPTGGNLE